MKTQRTLLVALSLSTMFAASGCKKDPAPAAAGAPSGAEKPAEGKPGEAPAAEKPAEGAAGEKPAEGAAPAGEKPAEGAAAAAGAPAAAPEGGAPAAGAPAAAPEGGAPAAAPEGGAPAAAPEGGAPPAAPEGGAPAAAPEGGAAAAPAAAPEGGDAQPADPFAPPKDVAAPPADAERTASGLASKVLKPGTSDRRPTAEDTVKVHYTGWTTDGKMFDSSLKHGAPLTFPLNGVIAGWTEGVALMRVGEKRRLWIPEALAYQGRPGAPAGMLVFDVELLDIQEKPKAPADVAEPPADAERTPTGIASKVLKPGTGAAHPTATSSVTVHYSGWTTDGKMFDSSVVRGQPATFPLNRVIPGWTEGVQLMVVGEKRRLWIPEELAYKGRPGAPQGMLVFDVELLSIQN